MHSLNGAVGSASIRRRLATLRPIGRLLFAAIFLVSVPSHFTQATFDHAAAAGYPVLRRPDR
jgi:hypothetical protein